MAATQPYSGKKTKKKLLAPDISLTLDRSEGSVLSDELDDSTELDLDDLDTPSDNSNEFEWEGKRIWPDVMCACTSCEWCIMNVNCSSMTH